MAAEPERFIMNPVIRVMDIPDRNGDVYGPSVLKAAYEEQSVKEVQAKMRAYYDEVMPKLVMGIDMAKFTDAPIITAVQQVPPYYLEQQVRNNSAAISDLTQTVAALQQEVASLKAALNIEKPLTPKRSV